MLLAASARRAARRALAARAAGASYSASFSARASASSSAAAATTSAAAAAAAAAAAVEQRAYWRRLYEAGGDAFSLPEPNANLARFWHELMPPPPPPPPPSPLAAQAQAQAESEAEALPRVLVPLCGRDVSMAWMAEAKGVGVLGVDFVGEPLRALAAELGGGLKPLLELRTAPAAEAEAEAEAEAGAGGAEPYHHPQHGSPVSVYQSNSLPTLILAHGDFLLMRAPRDLGGLFDACWDRAALTAVAPARRALYLRRVREALRPGGRLLLELLSTDAAVGEGGGALEERAALRLLAAAGLARARVLARKDVRADYPQFRPPGGARFLDEVVIVAERD